MFKKLFTLLFALLWCTVLFAQVNDAALTGGSGDPAETPGDILFVWDMDAVTGETGNLGVEYAEGFLWVSARGLVNPNGNSIWKFDVSSGSPVYVADYPQGNASAWGWRDLAYDGTYLMGSHDLDNLVNQMDPATGLVVGSFPGVIAPNRALAWDPATDHFWTKSFGGDLYEFDRTGAIINQFVDPISTYGAAWDPYSPGGPYLWLCGNNVAGNTEIHQYNPVTGTPTGLSYVVSVGGVVGGMDISADDLVPGKLVAVVMSQETPDNVYVVELGDYTSGGGLFFDDFEAYIAGQQLACQNPVDWDTWSNTPCGDDDATISTNYALSGVNSALIDAVAPRWVDLIKHLGDLTSGKHHIVFYMYIPTGQAGYFNTLSAFDPNNPAPPDTYWAMEVYFNAGGSGELNTEDNVVTPFTWIEDNWNKVEVVVDLDLDVGEFWFNGVMVHTWQWTNGASTGLGPLQLAANDFFAPTGTTPTDEMYIDNYTFGDWPVPVELTSFAANVNNLGEVVLNWSTASELNNFGFEVERSSESTDFRTIGFVGGNGTTTATQQYSYVDRTAGSGTYFYRLKQVDLDGTYEYFDAIEVDVTGPLTFDLGQNYPNPFNPSTNIQYSVPASGDVRLAVYNLIGEEVAVLVDGFSEAGFYEVTFDASSLPSGAYFYKLQSGNSVVAKKMLLMK